MSGDVVKRLIASEGLGVLRGYRGNLAAIPQAVANGWIPRGDEPGVGEHLATLCDHLAATGKVEDDAFLLRYALIVPGRLRGINPPLMVLEPDRNGFSVRRQREAAGQVTRLREALDLGRAFLADVGSDTERALLQLAASVEGETEFDATSRFDAYRSLSPEQAREAATVAIRLMDDLSCVYAEVGEIILLALASCRFEGLDPEIVRALRERAVFYPPCLYRDAGNDEAGAILALIDASGEASCIDPMLRCLAWTRGDVATASFRSWGDHPPAWATSLLVPPGAYPPDAGWHVDARGRRVELFDPRCRRLIPAAAGSAQVVPSRVSLPEACPRCRSALAALFDFAAISTELPTNAPRIIVGCLHCAAYGPTFTTYHEDGSWRWLAGPDEVPSTDAEPLKSRMLVLDEAQLPPFAPSPPFEMGDATLLGGVPGWLQDADYPHCPECGELMTHLAQHDNGSLGEEGVYFALFCPGCRVAAITYQQT